MATAPGHRLGQIIGDTLETSLFPLLKAFADEHSLYLDVKGPRPARSGRKVAWVDDLGNSHDLDFVLERGGSPKTIGTPAAFVESAWRRYTKHSRNKAQEIQGAVLPLLSRYAEVRPFAGAIVAGEWTPGALDQLRSNGFSVAHIPYPKIIAAFDRFGIAVSFDESTPDDVLQAQVDLYDGLSTDKRFALGDELRHCVPDQYTRFMTDLKRSVVRTISSIRVTPVHGRPREVATLGEAEAFIRSYRDDVGSGPFLRFEVLIRFDNGDRIEASFQRAADATAFLATFE